MKQYFLITASIILCHEDKIMMVREPRGRAWDFPSAVVDPDDTIDFALANMLSEDLGIRAYELQKAVHIKEDFYGTEEEHKLYIYYRGLASGEALKVSPIHRYTDVMWMTPAQIGKAGTYAENKAALIAADLWSG